MSEARIADLALWARGRLADLVDDAYTATVERIPLYRKGDLVPAPELRESITQNLRFIIGAIAHPDADLDLTVPKATGRRRAQQGVPLPEVLRAYRISFSTLWEALVDRASHARQQHDTDALLAAASTIWQLTDEHAVAVTESYRTTTAEMLVGRQQRRSAPWQSPGQRPFQLCQGHCNRQCYCLSDCRWPSGQRSLFHLRRPIRLECRPYQ